MPSAPPEDAAPSELAEPTGQTPGMTTTKKPEPTDRVALRRRAAGRPRATHSLLGIAVCCAGLGLAEVHARAAAPVAAGLLAALATRVACSVAHLGRTARWAAEAVRGTHEASSG